MAHVFKLVGRRSKLGIGWRAFRVICECGFSIDGTLTHSMADNISDHEIVRQEEELRLIRLAMTHHTLKHDGLEEFKFSGTDMAMIEHYAT